jgi:hypothetical protein
MDTIYALCEVGKEIILLNLDGLSSKDPFVSSYARNSGRNNEAFRRQEC